MTDVTRLAELKYDVTQLKAKISSEGNGPQKVIDEVKLVTLEAKMAAFENSLNQNNVQIQGKTKFSAQG